MSAPARRLSLPLLFLALMAYGLLRASAAAPTVGQVSVTRVGSGATAETIVMPVLDVGAASVASCEYSLDGGTTWTNAGPTAFKSSPTGKYCEFRAVNISLIADPNLVRVRVINGDQSLSLAPLPVVVDATAPKLTIVSPMAESATDDAPLVSVTTDETANCTHKLDAGVMAPLTSTGGLLHSYAYSDVPNGTHSLTVECQDWLGNSASKAVSFSVAPVFKDTTDHWALPYVAALKKKCPGVEGYRDAQGELLHEYRPNNPMSRAELVTTLVRCSYGFQNAPTMPAFDDVDLTQYYAGYVSKARELGWISGYPDGTFRPANPVSRAEALKIILLSQFSDPEIDEEGTIVGFVDVEAGWYRRFVSFAVARGYVEGFKDAGGNLTGYFKPAAPITRAEVAKVLALAKEWVQE